jgi:hypothetical protein
MIQAACENKYSFNMQVSAPAMAGPERDITYRRSLYPHTQSVFVLRGAFAE